MCLRDGSPSLQSQQQFYSQTTIDVTIDTYMHGEITTKSGKFYIIYP